MPDAAPTSAGCVEECVPGGRAVLRPRRPVQDARGERLAQQRTVHGVEVAPARVGQVGRLLVGRRRAQLVGDAEQQARERRLGGQRDPVLLRPQPRGVLVDAGDVDQAQGLLGGQQRAVALADRTQREVPVAEAKPGVAAAPSPIGAVANASRWRTTASAVSSTGSSSAGPRSALCGQPARSSSATVDRRTASTRGLTCPAAATSSADGRRSSCGSGPSAIADEREIVVVERVDQRVQRRDDPHRGAEVEHALVALQRGRDQRPRQDRVAQERRRQGDADPGALDRQVVEADDLDALELDAGSRRRRTARASRRSGWWRSQRGHQRTHGAVPRPVVDGAREQGSGG